MRRLLATSVLTFLLFAPAQRPDAPRARWAENRAGAVALALTAVVTIALSVYPQPLLHAAGLAAP